jgi:hypothetical protein
MSSNERTDGEISVHETPDEQLRFKPYDAPAGGWGALQARTAPRRLLPSSPDTAYYPETNPLLPLGHHDPKSKTPAAKSIPVFVRAQQAQT